MKETKLYKLYFEYRHEISSKGFGDEDDVFVCICRAEQVEKIQKKYSKLWQEIVDKNLGLLDNYTIEELTSDPVLQGWESFETPILEDIETGERFYYWDKKDGYELEPFPWD